MRIQKVPLTPKLEDKNLFFLKRNLPENFKLKKTGILKILCNISSLYLLDETIFNNEKYDKIFWERNNDYSIIIKTTKEFCHNLLTSSSYLSDMVDSLTKYDYNINTFIRDGN